MSKRQTPARPLLVAAADLHFRSRGAYVKRDMAADAPHSFLQIVDFCLTNTPEWLLLAGDLMESLDVDEATPDLHRLLHGMFSRLAAVGVKVGYVLGNHDAGVDWWKLHEGVHHLDGQQFYLGDMEAAALDWTPRGLLKTKLDAVPGDVEFLMLHQTAEELRAGNYTEPEVRLADLAGRGALKHILIGDFHDHRVVSVTGDTGEELQIYSPGSVCMQSISEPEQKSFFAFYRDGRRGLRAESVPLVTRPVVRLRVETEDDLDRFISRGAAEAVTTGEGLPEDLAMPMVEVFYYTDIPDAKVRLEAACRERFHYFPKPWDRDRPSRAVSETARRDLAALGLKGAVSQFFKGRPGVRNAALRLLDAPDPASELAVMRAEAVADGSEE